MIAEILELRDVLGQKSRLAERERGLCAPVLCDQGLIPRIYGWFCELRGRGGVLQEAVYPYRIVLVCSCGIGGRAYAEGIAAEHCGGGGFYGCHVCFA